MFRRVYPTTCLENFEVGEHVNAQERILAETARKFADEGRLSEALSLVERSRECIGSPNLITLLIVWMLKPTEDEARRILACFEKQVEMCSFVPALVAVASWITSPKRSSPTPAIFLSCLEKRRFSLQPSWDGKWKDPGKKGWIAIDGKGPSFVHDTERCLDTASCVRRWREWLERYLELGGDPRNPKYLMIYQRKKTWESRIVDQELGEVLGVYAEVENPNELRKFFRHLAWRNPSKEVPEGDISRHVLLLYCQSTRLDPFYESDWVYIAQCAMCQQDEVVGHIALRELAGLQRTPSAHAVFTQLVDKYGYPQITENVLDDLAAATMQNPIWTDVIRRIPVDGNARRILMDYSRAEYERIRVR